MSLPILYGPGFSYFIRSMRLLFQFKGIQHAVSKTPFGVEIPLFGDQHAQLHPFKKMPVLIDGDVVLPETLAIARYLESQPGPSFMPGDSKQQATILSLASMISLYVHKALMGNIILEFRFPKGADGAIRFDVMEENIPYAKSVLDWLVTRLDMRLFIAGEQFSLADAYLIPMIDYLHQMPEPFNLSHGYNSLCRYIEYHRTQPYSIGILGPPV